MNDGRERGPGLRRASQLDAVHRSPDGDLPCPPGRADRLAGRDPAERGQVLPLVVMRLERGGIEEHCRAVAACLAVQRCCDQVADAARGQRVLGREQPIIAGQAHLPRRAIASRSSPAPRRRAVSAGTGAVKNVQACAPIPERDTSSPAGTPSARAALT